MRYVIKKIPYWGFVKISVFINFIFGFLIGLIYAFFFGLMMGAVRNLPGVAEEMGGAEPMAFGVMMILMPIIFAFGSAFFNTILGVILVFFYNILSGFIGGLELDLEPAYDESMQNRPQTAPAEPVPQQQVYSTPPPTYTETTTPPPPPPQDDNRDNKSE